jgi:hypothetical protein
LRVTSCKQQKTLKDLNVFDTSSLQILLLLADGDPQTPIAFTDHHSVGRSMVYALLRCCWPTSH